jgi:hypothetical protein
VVVRLKALKFLVYQRIVHDVLPVGEANRLLVFIGDVDDALAGRPSKAYKPAGQAVIDRLFPPIGRALEAGAPILTGRELNRIGFQAAVQDDADRVGPDVVVVRGPTPDVEEAVAAVPPVPVSPGAIAAFAVFALLALFAVGIGWSLYLAPRALPVVSLALAPGLGLAAASIVVFVAMRLGIHPTGAGAVVELVVLLALSAIAGRAWWKHRYPGRHRSPEAERQDGIGAGPAIVEEPAGSGPGE